MERRRLGGTDLELSVIGLGTWVFGGRWGGADDADSIAACHAALDAGINWIDTADIYGQHRAERIVGKVLAERRDAIIVATKGGVLAYGPLAHGLLTGKMTAETTFAPTDWRRESELFADDAFGERIAVVDELAGVAAQAGRAGGVAELAVAWVLRRPEVTSAIIGARDAAQATANAALAGRPLTDDEAAAIDEVLARHPAASRHYGHGEPPDRDDG